MADLAVRFRLSFGWFARASDGTKLAILAVVFLALLVPLRIAEQTSLAQDYPRVDGSTSTHPLQVLVACERLGASCQWQDPSSPRDLRTIGPDRNTTDSGGAAERLLSLKHTGTHQSYTRLISKETDLILVARSPSRDELRSAREAGVQLDARPVALDAFVFLANAENPVDSVDVDLVRSVYQGKLTDWAQLGGTEGAIRAYSRDRNSGSQELMESLVMKGTVTIEEPTIVMMVPTMGGMVTSVAQDSRAIGYIVYYYTSNQLIDPEVKMIGVDGVKPSAETIGDQTYPLVAEVYVVTRSNIPPYHPAARLRDWLLTPEGQAVVAKSGYVPVAKAR